MPWVWISIGSNVQPERNVRGAIAALRRRYPGLVVSSVYESDAVGFAGEPFYNLVAGLATDEGVELVAAALRAIEDAHGRIRGGEKYGPRTLDLDLLTYGNQVIDQGPVRVPRDEILRNAFVLGPLAEVAGDERHPRLGKTYGELWRGFDRETQPLRRLSLEL